MKEEFAALRENFAGDISTENLTKTIYATDASVYRKIPLAVALPRNKADIQKLIEFCNQHRLSLIPRAAGTSLAGQCVGEGIVVDISKYFTEITGFDEGAKTIRLQPGIIRDDLNRFLKPYGLFFSPNTSTSNRCMLGGMLGNNSSGTTSIKYGVTRDKILEMSCILSDGSEVLFKPLTKEEFHEKRKLDSLEGKIYRDLYDLLKSEAVQETVQRELPRPEIHRRNTGYAIDELLRSDVFSTSEGKINICTLLAGSEGTLAFTTEMTVKLDVLPPEESALIAAHFKSVEACLEAIVPVMEHSLFTCEMMDKTILDCTKNNLKYKNDRFFLKDEPQSILMLELRDHSKEDLNRQIEQLLSDLNEKTGSYHNPILKGNDINRAINLRKAGLGLMGSMRGDAKAVACIEDTAVAISDLANYISEFTQLMLKFDQRAVYYAHAGAGELHLRPILNLKKSGDVKHFRQITEEVVKLVKKYRGSLSGEHGDGRVRAEFIETMVGAQNYDLFKSIKNLFDPQHIFNPGKIVFPEAMDESLRYTPDRQEPQIDSFMNFEDTNGILRAVEQCNGSGDCRKSPEAGGTMCPSYRATKDEKDSTRGRANALREFLTTSEQSNPYDYKELKEVLELCISCKGCKNECPSNVDMSTYKAEFQYQYYKSNIRPLRDRVLAENYKMNSKAIKIPGLTNALFSNRLSSRLIKSALGIAQQRSLPQVAKKSLRKLIADGEVDLVPKEKKGAVFLFIDEFTELLDVNIGRDAIELLVALGYEVKVTDHSESGRSYLSKGFLEKSKELAQQNIEAFKDKVNSQIPLVGIEPSAILSFRDEYLRLVDNTDEAKKIADNTLLFDEFIAREIKSGHISAGQFHSKTQRIKLHGHCHQKALAGNKSTFDMLNLPKNHEVRIIPSGCCGMAGSFGYEKEHYDLSMKMGELSLFPAIKNAENSIQIAATGTSCRHQIKDGTGRHAQHPISILRSALI